MKTMRFPRYMYRSVASAKGGWGGAGGRPSCRVGQYVHEAHLHQVHASSSGSPSQKR